MFSGRRDECRLLVEFVRPFRFIILITAVGPLTLLTVGSTISTAAAIFLLAARKGRRR